MIALLLDEVSAPATHSVTSLDSAAAGRAEMAVPAHRDGDSDAATEDDVFVFPATAAQRRFWLLDQLVQGGNPALNMPLAVRLRGPLDRAALERAFNEILRRHEVLRTSFHCEKGQLLQVIAPKLTMSVPVVDVQDFPEAERARVPVHLIAEEAQRVFDLARGPLLRARLVRLSGTEHLLLFPIHHIVSDGWSVGVLTRELFALYAAFAQGRPSPLPELPIQFADFAQWQQDGLASGGFDPQINYWRGQLAGELPVLDLPQDRPRQAWRNQAAPGAVRTRRLPGILAERLKALAVREGASPFMLFLTAFTVLLNRCAGGREDVLVSTPSANRNRPEVESLIGPFVNPLLLRFDLTGEPTFRELLVRARRVVLGAYEHADAPFEKLVEELQPRRLQINFLYQNAFLQAAQLPDLSIEPLHPDTGGALFEWTVLAVDDADGVRVELEYQTDLFDAATIDGVLAIYERLLTAVADGGGLAMPIWRLPLVSGEEGQTGAGMLLRADRWRLPDASARWVECCTDATSPDPGRLRAGVGLRVLDGHQQSLPVGVPGEIQVEGLLDKALFRTGDLGRWLPDASVEWLGPITRQCRVDGLRADLRATEAALRTHPHLREVAVLNRGGAGEGCCPVAYFVSDGVPAAFVNAEQLRSFLRDKLPDDRMPVAFMLLPRFPLTADGRLDEAALPAPDLTAGPMTEENYQAPYLPIHHQIIGIWQELLGVRTVGVRDDFFTLGGNSLLAMRMLYRIEQDFGKTILPATLFEHATVEHLAAEVLRHGDTEASPDLVKVQDSGSKTPIFFLHGDIAGGGFYCRKLSRVLGEEQPFYALPPMDIARPLEDRPSIADMAAAHVAVIRSVRPHGPYVIGGFCLGGLVAYEVARQLEADGETVERLLIIDAWPVNRRLKMLRRMAERVGKWRGLDTSHHLYLFCHWHYWTVHWDRLRRMSVREKLTMVGRRLRRGSRSPVPEIPVISERENAPASPSVWFDPVQDIPVLFMWAAGGYRAQPYHGRTTILISNDLLRDSNGGDPLKEWGRFVTNLESAELKGNHLECITAHVDELAATIRRCLEPRAA